MKNKYGAIALGVLILVLILVSACGGGKSTTAATATSTKTATATTTKNATTTATQTATTLKTTTATATATIPTPTKTSTPTGNSLNNILGTGAGITNVKYDATVTAPGTGTIQYTVYMKNYKKFREEMTAQGTTTIIIFDMDKNVMYTYMPDQNIAMQMTLNMSQVPQGPSGDPNSILQYNPQITGTETIDGKSCTVFTYNMPGTGTVKYWIWTDKGFPLKMETTTSQGTTTITYTNIDFSNIPDSKFELPSGVIITTVSS